MRIITDLLRSYNSYECLTTLQYYLTYVYACNAYLCILVYAVNTEIYYCYAFQHERFIFW